MIRDAANRNIKEPIDYLIEASKKSRKLGLVLHLYGNDELAKEADCLNAKIAKELLERPIEEWETAQHPVAGKNC